MIHFSSLQANFVLSLLKALFVCSFISLPSLAKFAQEMTLTTKLFKFMSSMKNCICVSFKELKSSFSDTISLIVVKLTSLFACDKR